MISRTENRRVYGALAVWAFSAVLAGAVVTSYHVPFLSPDPSILSLATSDGLPSWHAVHVLSDSCGCSRKVMEQLLIRGPQPELTEIVAVVEGDAAPLEGGEELIAKLHRRGFAIVRVSAAAVQKRFGLFGVPLLAVGSPGAKVVYLGGYGTDGDSGLKIVRAMQHGASYRHFDVIGCAVGKRLRMAVDPLKIKY